MNTEAIRQSCSQTARLLDEPLYGTAPVGQSWVLVEQPGAWGPDALAESNLDPNFVQDLVRRTEAIGCKVMLIRRSAGRYDRSALTCYLANMSRSGSWMEQLTLGDPAELLDLDLEGLASAVTPGIGPPAEEAFLVCTHGRRDPCCAEYGRALMKALVAEPNVWESSHQGGHRFAANLACFPHGLFYGKVGPAGAQGVIDSFRDGQILLPHFRGRTSDEQVVQAADYLVRNATGITAIDALGIESVVLEEAEAKVVMIDGHRRYTAKLELTEGPPRSESCRKPDKLTIRKLWKLIDLQGVHRPGGVPGMPAAHT